jgi:hypothetical protein
MFVYDKHFDADAGYTKDSYRSSSVPDSPFIRFAEQALLELGITNSREEPYSRHSIATAVTHVRKGGRRNLANRSAGASDKL